ncbi:MAG: aspartate aminotransferase family protein [Chitinophagaceae bacterium]|nr:aspartate aminotransferase family protein [Chitinophagaceae bacterium]
MRDKKEIFYNWLAQTSSNPIGIEIEKAEGVFLYTPQGKKILDLISGIAVSNIGHRHPTVVEAIKKQLEKYMHIMVYGEVILSPQILLAEALKETLPPPLDNIYFVNSGSEAIEGAMKIAKKMTRRHTIITCKHCYHGSTQGALSLLSDDGMRRKYRPLLPSVLHIEFGNEENLSVINEETACVIIETVQGEAGVRTASTLYFQKLREKCSHNGALLIVDEIQCGFGRTGFFWAFQDYGFIPDILVSAKGMGGGLPLGAFIAPQHIMQSISNNPPLGHITTFGGNPLSAAASLATMQVIKAENILQNIPFKQALFCSLLLHPLIKEVRAKGLMMAIELQKDISISKLVSLCLENGILVDWFLFCNNSLRIAPPLTISEDEIHIACNGILKSLRILDGSYSRFHKDYS